MLNSNNIPKDVMSLDATLQQWSDKFLNIGLHIGFFSLLQHITSLIEKNPTIHSKITYIVVFIFHMHVIVNQCFGPKPRNDSITFIACYIFLHDYNLHMWLGSRAKIFRIQTINQMAKNVFFSPSTSLGTRH
jgi:hypothetical protein